MEKKTRKTACYIFNLNPSAHPQSIEWKSAQKNARRPSN